MFCSSLQIPIPSVPVFQPSTPIPERLEAVQRYIRELQYPLLLHYSLVLITQEERARGLLLPVTNRKAPSIVAKGELKFVA